MVASIGGSGSGVAGWADAVFSRLDTKNRGEIDKADLAGALAATGDEGGDGAVDDMFSAIDSDGDGKVIKSELTEAMTRLSDQLNAQFDAARVQGGMPPGPPPGGQAADSGQARGGAAAAGSGAGMGGMAAGGARGAGGVHGAGAPGGDAGKAEDTDETDSTGTDYIAAADTDGDGTVSDAEQAAYDKKVASGEAGADSATASAQGPDGPRDPARDLAHALDLLKAYADSASGGAGKASGSAAGAGTGTGAGAGGSLSVEA